MDGESTSEKYDLSEVYPLSCDLDLIVVWCDAKQWCLVDAFNMDDDEAITGTNATNAYRLFRKKVHN